MSSKRVLALKLFKLQQASRKVNVKRKEDKFKRSRGQVIIDMLSRVPTDHDETYNNLMYKLKRTYQLLYCAPNGDTGLMVALKNGAWCNNGPLLVELARVCSWSFRDKPQTFSLAMMCSTYYMVPMLVVRYGGFEVSTLYLTQDKPDWRMTLTMVCWMSRGLEPELVMQGKNGEHLIKVRQIVKKFGRDLEFQVSACVRLLHPEYYRKLR